MCYSGGPSIMRLCRSCFPANLSNIYLPTCQILKQSDKNFLSYLKNVEVPVDMAEVADAAATKP